MAFASSNAAQQAPSVSEGPEVVEINTESFGFTALAQGSLGPSKLKLLPAPWPTENLPTGTASLLSAAPMRGLLAAASPDALLLSYTENVRKAFQQKPGENDIIEGFKPDFTIPIPQPRHLVFSADEDYLVLSPEEGGGLHVYSVDGLLQGNTDPELRIETNNAPVRTLLPNPFSDVAHYMIVISESGRLEIADITTGQKSLIKDDGVTCASWSVRGRAYVVGFKDGSAAVFMATDTELGKIPRPPGVEEGLGVSSICYLGNDDFFLVHSPLPGAKDSDPNDAQYNFVKTKFLKDETPKFKDFTFRKFDYDVLFPHLEGDAPSRSFPTRFSVSRLRNWEPMLKDVLILARANSSEIVVITNTSDKIAPDQEAVGEYQITCLQGDRRPQIPRQSIGDDMESAPIGEVLDLSGKEKVSHPAKRLVGDGIVESPGPLPAYFVLTNEGLLAAWWVVWDEALKKGTSFSGLTATNGTAKEASKEAATNKPQSSSLFGQQSLDTQGSKGTSLFGQPTSAQRANASPFAPPPKPSSTDNVPSFPTRTTPSFGTPSTPTFGQPTNKPAFGQPSKPAFGQPSQPLFGSASKISGTGFGAPAQTSQTPPSQTKANPFAAAAGAKSGFAAFGSTSASPFGSFESAPGGPSPFSKGSQKPAFAGGSNGFTGLSKEPSFGASTVNLTDSGTPQGGSFFSSTATSSFASNAESNTGRKEDARNRERDEATPTPQTQPTQSKGLFGLTGGFKLGSTFSGDKTSDQDTEKPEASGGSLFGNNFLSGATSKPPPPVTPQQEKDSINFSTTPATQPKPNFQFPGGMSTFAPKSEEELPPIAGSPPVQVEAPSSSVSSSPLDREEEENEGTDEEEEEEEEEEAGTDEDDQSDDQSDDISVEEQEDGSGDQETDRSRPAQSGWSFQNSAHPSPRIPPAAPTPPPALSQPFKPASRPPTQSVKPSPLSFGQSAATAQHKPFGGAKPPPSFAPTSRPQSNLRASSPLRSASTSAINTVRREPLPGSGSSLSASIQKQPPQPVEPRPEVSDLVDDDDERIREELASDIIPCRTLDPFIARQEYNGYALGKTGHAAQIEIVYRDINSMVDTLGLNSRSLKAFSDYHQRAHRKTNLTQEDLHIINEQGQDGSWFEEWSFVEMEDLKMLEDQLDRQLEKGRVQDVIEKLGQLTRLLHDTGKLSTKINDVRRQIISRRDPEKLDAVRKASLPKELADHQKALRNAYARLLTLLGQAEEAVLLLKSKLATYNAEHGKTGAVPTVDAIKKTINKLIAITEKKNNDITLLEAQFRKVGLANPSRPTSSSSRAIGTPARRSRGARGESPFATPPTNRSHVSLSKLNRTAMTPELETTPTKGFGLFYTPEGSPSADRTLAKLGELGDDDLAQLREKAKRRRKAAEGLEEVLINKGVQQSRVF